MERGCVSGSGCGCVTECNITTSTLTLYTTDAGCVYSLAVCVNGRHVAAGRHDGVIDVYTTDHRTLIRSIHAHRDAVKVTLNGLSYSQRLHSYNFKNLFGASLFI